jgi:hypothetical protein
MPMFWRNVLSPSALKMEAASTSGTSVNFYHTTRKTAQKIHIFIYHGSSGFLNRSHILHKHNVNFVCGA